MKSKLVYLRTFSGNKASVYSIATEEIEGTLFDRFLVAYKSLYLENVRAWQDDVKLTREVHEMMHYSKIIRTKLTNGELFFSEDGLRFGGNFILTK